jgi:hypothetical protein
VETPKKAKRRKRTPEGYCSKCGQRLPREDKPDKAARRWCVASPYGVVKYVDAVTAFQAHRAACMGPLARFHQCNITEVKEHDA